MAKIIHRKARAWPICIFIFALQGPLVLELVHAQSSDESEAPSFAKEFTIDLDPLQRPIHQANQKQEEAAPLVALPVASGVVLVGDPMVQSRSLLLRGFAAEHVGLIWNGFKLNDFTSTSGAFVGEDLVREFSGEVRVLKGPQSLLYGSHAMGGVIVLSPGPRDQSKLQFWKGDSPGGSVAFSKIVSWQSEDLQLRDQVKLGLAGVFYEVENPSHIGDAKSSERDQKRLQSASLFTTWQTDAPVGFGQLSSPLSFGYFGNVRNLRADDDSFPTDDPDAFTEQDEERHGLSVDGGRATQPWSAKLQLSKIKRRSANFDSGGELFVYDETYLGRQRLLSVSSTWEQSRSAKYFAQLELEDTQSQLQNAVVNPSVSPPSLVHREALVLGGVWNTSGAPNDDSLGSSSFGLGARVECPEGLCRPLVNASYQRALSSQALQSLSVGQGFKNPSYYQLYSVYGSPELRSESLWSLELAHRYWQGPMEYGLTVFHNELSDQIDYDLAAMKYKNIKRSLIRGLEFELYWHSDWARYEGAFTLLDAIDLLSRETLSRRPRYYSAHKFNFKTGANFESIAKLNILGPRKDGQQKLAEKWLWDLTWQYRAQQREIEWGIKNIFDDRHEEISGYNANERRLWIAISFFNLL